jgi:hypothetical protein
MLAVHYGRATSITAAAQTKHVPCLPCKCSRYHSKYCTKLPTSIVGFLCMTGSLLPNLYQSTSLVIQIQLAATWLVCQRQDSNLVVESTQVYWRTESIGMRILKEKVKPARSYV